MPRPTLDLLRAFLLALIALGLAGMGTELVLLRHYKEPWQFVPLILIGTAIAVILWHLATRSAASVRAFRVLMIGFVAAGGLGVILHYQGNLEFQRETNPDLEGWALFMKVIHAQVPPALAPGAMAQLGLLGLVFAYRHPALARSHDDPSTIQGA